jgi:hypothetical protein
LLNTFKNDFNKPDFGQHPLRVFYWDIETYGMKYKNEHKIKIRKKSN